VSSTTTRVSLYKPAGGENVNVTTDINNNLDKLDTNLNFRVAANATARNAISPFWEGLNVRDTDTSRTWVSNGSAPISASWSQIPNSGSTYDADLDLTAGKQLNIGASTSLAAVAVVGSAIDADTLSSRITGDTQSRFLVEADGAMYWGPGGASVTDTKFYRSGVGALTTDNSLSVGGNLTVTGIGQQQYATTGSNRTVSATAMAAVTGMTLPVATNAVYTFQVVIFVTSAVAGTNDLKVGFTCPASATVDFTGHGLQAAQQTTSIGSSEFTTQIGATGSGSFITYGTTTSATAIIITGRCTTAGTSGALALACGGVSGTGNNTINAVSYMTAVRVA
jgi:hypothetical protein